MFVELSNYLDNFDFVITLSKKDNKIIYGIVPKNKEKGIVNITPLVGSATAKELDEQIGAIILEGIGRNVDKLSNIEDFVGAVNKAAAKKSTPAATPAKEVKKEEPKAPPKPRMLSDVSSVKLPKDQQAAMNTITNYLKRMADSKDDEGMVSFCRSTIIKAAESIRDIKDIVTIVNNEMAKVIPVAEPPKQEPVGMEPEATPIDDDNTDDTDEDEDGVPADEDDAVEQNQPLPAANAASEDTLRKEHEERAKKAQQANKKKALVETPLPPPADKDEVSIF